MNRIILFLLLSVLILNGCKKKPKQNIYEEVKVPAFANPELTVNAYIKAINDNDLEKFNECHHPTTRLKVHSGEYERLKDELKYLHITKFELLKTTYSADGNRAQVRLNWELKYTDPNTQKDHIVKDSGRIFELVRFGIQWLINPTNSSSSFWSTPKVTNEDVEKEKSNEKK